MPTFSPHAYSWSEFSFECLMHFLGMGLVYLTIFLIVCLILAVVAIRRRSPFLRPVARLGLFFGLLLVVGSIFNGFWSCLIWGRLYFSTDYLFDFSPLWPITQSVIDASFGDMRGQLFGISLFQLQLVWLLFAVGTWAISIFFYWLICKRPPSNQLIQSVSYETAS
jgi:hypothetical protein